MSNGGALARLPMSAILKDLEPTPQAKFIRFTSYYDRAITRDSIFPPGNFLSFPYHEALWIKEMTNELAVFAIGIYEHTLPKQHGSPLRVVIP